MFEEESEIIPIKQEEETKFELDDFMKALDLFEEEIHEYVEPSNDEHIAPITKDVPKEEIKTVKDKIEPKQVNDKNLEDIFDDTFTAMSKVRYVIVRKGDTYASLAKKYNMEEHVLAKANNYKVLESRCVIEIPIR